MNSNGNLILEFDVFITFDLSLCVTFYSICFLESQNISKVIAFLRLS